MTLAWRYGIRSDVGKVREGNEDSAFAGSRLIAVADGMGGAAAGEVASRVVITHLADLDEDVAGPDVLGALAQSLRDANDELRAMVRADPRLTGMGTTVTALLVAGQRLGLVHIGDSRCYLFRDGRLTPVTRDHTFVQQLVEAGEITEEEATVHPKRSLIMRVLDGRESPDLDLSVREGRVGDRYLLCSDGLSSFVSPATIAETLLIEHPQAAADRLVDLALRAGGPDNITAVVADAIDDRDASDDRTFSGAAAEAAAPAPAPVRAGRRVRGLGLHRRSQPTATELPRRSRWLVPSVILAILVLVGLGILGGWLYVRTQYYVGTSQGHVAIYRGVSGTIGPIHLSSVEERGPLVSDLPPESQRQIEQDIDADSLSDARRIVAALETGTRVDSGSPSRTPSTTTPSTTSPPGSVPVSADASSGATP